MRFHRNRSLKIYVTFCCEMQQSTNKVIKSLSKELIKLRQSNYIYIECYFDVIIRSKHFSLCHEVMIWSCKQKENLQSWESKRCKLKKKYSIIAINVVLNPGKKFKHAISFVRKKFQLFFTASFQNTFVILRKVHTRLLVLWKYIQIFF